VGCRGKWPEVGGGS